MVGHVSRSSGSANSTGHSKRKKAGQIKGWKWKDNIKEWTLPALLGQLKTRGQGGKGLLRPNTGKVIGENRSSNVLFTFLVIRGQLLIS